jgi:hypothetical protein
MKYIKLYEEVEFSNEIKWIKTKFSKDPDFIFSGDKLSDEQLKRESKFPFKLDEWVIYIGNIESIKGEFHKIISIDLDTTKYVEKNYCIIREEGNFGYWVSKNEIEKLPIDMSIETYKSARKYNL